MKQNPAWNGAEIDRAFSEQNENMDQQTIYE